MFKINGKNNRKYSNKNEKQKLGAGKIFLQSIKSSLLKNENFQPYIQSMRIRVIFEC